MMMHAGYYGIAVFVKVQQTGCNKQGRVSQFEIFRFL